MRANKPILHRDDPKNAPLIGNVKVTREDWLNSAIAALIENGVEGVKVQKIGADMGVSRSSFYWYFASRQELLGALLAHWRETNTASLIAMAQKPSATITEAVSNVFRCAINPELFDARLDFAIRDWARRDAKVRSALEASDHSRLTALQDMFQRHGYAELDSIARARILYYMQIGYDDAQLNEPMEVRNTLVPAYLRGFTGVEPTDEEVASLKRYTLSL